MRDRYRQLVIAGWYCASQIIVDGKEVTCGTFNNEEKEKQTHCHACLEPEYEMTGYPQEVPVIGVPVIIQTDAVGKQTVTIQKRKCSPHCRHIACTS